MKRIFFLSLLTLMSLLPLAADEKVYGPAAFGMGPEINRNTEKDPVAFGLNFSFDHNLGNSFSAGIALGTSRNFSDFSFFPVINVYELGGLFRWYFLKGKESHSGFFIQAEGGAYMAQKIQNHTLEEQSVLPMGGLRSGYRLPFGQVYIEPYARAGYPFIFGVGLLMGVRHIDEW